MLLDLNYYYIQNWNTNISDCNIR